MNAIICSRSRGCELVQIPMLDRERERRLAGAILRCRREGLDWERDGEVCEIMGWAVQGRLL